MTTQIGAIASEAATFASIVTFRELLRSRTAILSLFPVLVIWGFGLGIAALDLPVWGEEWIGTRLLAMAAVLIVITVLSMLPLLIWATFDVQERERVQNEAVRELDNHGWRPLVREIQFYYSAVHDESRYRFPVFLASITSLFGWVLVIFATGPGIIRPLLADGSINDFLVGITHAHPIAFAFMGAYVFVVGMMIRRYHRGDLLPSVFMAVVYQIWTAMMVTFVASIVFVLALARDPDPGSGIPAATEPETPRLLTNGPESLGSKSSLSLVAVSFATGFAPWPTLRALRRYGGSVLRRVVKNGKERESDEPRFPLTSLEGFNEYHANRLLEEGIEEIPNLAMADIPRLMVSVRMGGVRLLDWVDQALLHTYAQQDLEALKELGIRNASGLVRSYIGPDIQPNARIAWESLAPYSKYLRDLEKRYPGLDGRLYHYVVALWHHPNFQWLIWLHERAQAAA